VRNVLKMAGDAVSTVVVSPLAFTCWSEARVSPAREGIFRFWAQFLAVVPGLPGVFLRRAFYRLTLQSCASSFYVGFGALFTHRQVVVGRGVHVGPYALIGCARIGEGCLIGSRASILSGSRLHEFDPAAGWTPFDASRLTQVEIGDRTWIGEGAIVMADVGSRCMVSAGAVVSAPVPHGVKVAGNPARFVGRVDQQES
jgi:virginiamycin A acetyltransferase